MSNIEKGGARAGAGRPSVGSERYEVFLGKGAIYIVHVRKLGYPYTVVHGSPYTTYLNIVAITASPRLYRDTMSLKVSDIGTMKQRASLACLQVSN